MVTCLHELSTGMAATKSQALRLKWDQEPRADDELHRPKPHRRRTGGLSHPPPLADLHDAGTLRCAGVVAGGLVSCQWKLARCRLGAPRPRANRVASRSGQMEKFRLRCHEQARDDESWRLRHALGRAAPQ